MWYFEWTNFMWTMCVLVTLKIAHTDIIIHSTTAMIDVHSNITWKQNDLVWQQQQHSRHWSHPFSFSFVLFLSRSLLRSLYLSVYLLLSALNTKWNCMWRGHFSLDTLYIFFGFFLFVSIQIHHTERNTTRQKFMYLVLERRVDRWQQPQQKTKHFAHFQFRMAIALIYLKVQTDTFDYSGLWIFAAPKITIPNNIVYIPYILPTSIYYPCKREWNTHTISVASRRTLYKYRPCTLYTLLIFIYIYFAGVLFIT